MAPSNGRKLKILLGKKIKNLFPTSPIIYNINVNVVSDEMGIAATIHI